MSIKLPFTFLISLALLITIIKCEDCKTPAECYIKAISILQRDREEMRSQMDIYEKKLQETVAKYENLLNTAKTEMQGKYEKCQNDLNTSNENLNQSINSVRGSILRDLQCTSVHQGGNVAACPGGFRAVSCSCGSGCGSWGLDHNSGACRCGCGEWTTVTCCKLA